MSEVKAARGKLYQAINEDSHCIVGSPSKTIGMESDRQTLADLIQFMEDTNTMRLLRNANFADWSFGIDEMDGLDRLMRNSKGAEHEFIDQELEVRRQTLLRAVQTFQHSFAENTRPTPYARSYNAIPRNWEKEQPERFAKTVEELHAAADAVCTAYDELIRLGRNRLAV
ncbi:hypothetical protein [Beijerinckia mobilis]|uniref:hypothetical protein n=1 Tax=Beijerinckia mobilis TaxID=231434 RepID=UPI0005598737|nr:hypothetical protein [Beijerinckia mobilis]